jgi:hypothetical protein
MTTTTDLATTASPPNIDELTKKMMATPAGRRELAKQSIVFFDTYYCGMEPAPHRTRWLKRINGSWKQNKARRRQTKFLLLAPRKHGKTELSVTEILYLIATNRNIRILLICSTLSQAKKRIKRVKKLLATPRFQEDWCSGSVEDGLGPLRGDTRGDQVWTSTAIEVIRTSTSINPTLEGIGIGGEPTGDHVDVVILDDPESKKRLKSATVRAETRNFFSATVTPILEPEGLMLVLGTRKHYDDVYGHLIDDTTWDLIHDRAIVKFPTVHRPVYTVNEFGRRMLLRYHISDDHEVLWPKRRSIQYLLRIRDSVGTQVFAQEYDNIVQDGSDSFFKIGWITTAKSLGDRISLGPVEHGGGPWPDDLVVVQPWDLALDTDPDHAKEADNDYTVGLTWGWQPSTERRFLMDIFRKRGKSPQEIQEAILEMYVRWQRFMPDGRRLVKRVIVEANNFRHDPHLGHRSRPRVRRSPPCQGPAGPAHDWAAEGGPDEGPPHPPVRLGALRRRHPPEDRRRPRPHRRLPHRARPLRPRPPRRLRDGGVHRRGRAPGLHLRPRPKEGRGESAGQAA